MNTLFIISSIHDWFNAAAFAVFCGIIGKIYMEVLEK